MARISTTETNSSLKPIKKVAIVTFLFLLVQGIIGLISYSIIHFTNQVDIMDLMLIISGSLFIGFIGGRE